MKVLKIGTRGSALALTQTGWVARELKKKISRLQVKIVVIKTSGDRLSQGAGGNGGGLGTIPPVNRKSLFTKEIEDALLEGRIDCAVHSLKDMPAEIPPKLIIAAVPKRLDHRD